VKKLIIIIGSAALALTATIGLGSAALAVTAIAPSAADAATGKYCGTGAHGFPGIVAVGPTSCGFARNVERAARNLPSVQVRRDVWAPPARTLRVWSPTTHRLYRMHCRFAMPYGGGWHYACRGGKGAHVKLVS